MTVNYDEGDSEGKYDRGRADTAGEFVPGKTNVRKAIKHARIP